MLVIWEKKIKIKDAWKTCYYNKNIEKDFSKLIDK